MCEFPGQNDHDLQDSETGNLAYQSLAAVFGQSNTSNLACNEYDTQKDNDQILL